MAKKSSPKKLSKKGGFDFLLFLIVAGTIVVLVLSVFNFFLYSTTKNREVLGIKIQTDAKTVLSFEKSFWQAFLKKNPSYLPGWLELAKIEVQLEDIDNAKEALNKAREIDPNSELLKETAKKLGLFDL